MQRLPALVSDKLRKGSNAASRKASDTFSAVRRRAMLGRSQSQNSQTSSSSDAGFWKRPSIQRQDSAESSASTVSNSIEDDLTGARHRPLLSSPSLPDERLVENRNRIHPPPVYTASVSVTGNSKRGSVRRSVSDTASLMSSRRAHATYKNHSTTGHSALGNPDLPLAFSGWIYLSVGGKHARRDKPGKFRKRYCKLRDVLCTFYDEPKGEARKEDRHMILTVSTLASVNCGMVLSNHNDEILYLHTENQEDYHMWFQAYNEAIVAAKNSRVVRKRSLRNLSKKLNVRQEQVAQGRKLTDPNSYVSVVLPSTNASSFGPTRSKSSSISSMGKQSSFSGDSRGSSLSTTSSSQSKSTTDSSRLAREEEAISGWLMKECGFFRKKFRRRYFVVTGSSVAYFDVNMEGREAMGSGRITHCRLLPEIGYGLELELDETKVLRLELKNQAEVEFWYETFKSHAEPVTSAAI